METKVIDLKKLFAVTLTMLALVGLTVSSGLAAQSPQVPLPGSAIPQFVDPLPDLEAIVAGSGQIELQMTEFQANVLSANTIPGYTGTWVWGYLQPGQLPGLAILVQ